MGSFTLGAAVLASSWKPFLHDKLLILDFPPVPTINCSSCWMVELGLFHGKRKCCTQFPALPNFLVGEVLQDKPDSLGAKQLQSWLLQNRGGPFQIHTPPPIAAQYEKRYDDMTQKPGCLYLDGDGFCSIYEQRPPLCLGYNCLYPTDNMAMMGFWNTLASLLQLHTAVAGPYLLTAQGFDMEEFQRFWQSVTLDELWDGETIREEHSERLWQGRNPEEFYKSCATYIQEHADTIREELIEYRNDQLVTLLHNSGLLTPEREAQIYSQSLEPKVMEPPTPAMNTFLRQNLVYFEEHFWTIQENESYALWFHQQAFGNNNPEVVMQ
ncbi:MAG: hypothetical protein EP343_14130 [Deltaproteobacteria bacterium]|nr:MAG: hypothetical protein EP343_14130 [Deltaproteobacteria bacterium]